MKKTAFVLALLLCFAPLLLTSCGNKIETVTLNVYNWGQYMPDGSDDLADVNLLFADYFNENLADKYGFNLEVNLSTYASNEDMYNKIVSGSANFDIIVPSDYMVERMIDEDLLVELDFDIIPNYEYISEEFKTAYSTYDPECKYSVPYSYGMVGVIYNTNYVDEEDVGSWDLLWNEKYKGKILQFNNPRDAFGTALYRLGYSVNTTDHQKWEEAKDSLLEQKPLIQAYVMDEIFNKMTSGSAWIAPYYAGDFLTMYDGNDDLAFFYPEEGTNIFVDAMCVPKCARHPEVAMEYINFLLSEEAAVTVSEYMGYASANKLVYENEDYIAYMEDWYEDAMAVTYPDGVLIDNERDLKDLDPEEERRSFYRTIGNTEENGNLLDFTNNLWSELKVESSTESWIIVTDIVILAALAGWLIFKAVRKKAREKEY